MLDEISTPLTTAQLDSIAIMVDDQRVKFYFHLTMESLYGEDWMQTQDPAFVASELESFTAGWTKTIAQQVNEGVALANGSEPCSIECYDEEAGCGDISGALVGSGSAILGSEVMTMAGATGLVGSTGTALIGLGGWLAACYGTAVVGCLTGCGGYPEDATPGVMCPEPQMVCSVHQPNSFFDQTTHQCWDNDPNEPNPEEIILAWCWEYTPLE